MMVLTNIAGIILINGLLLTCLVNWVFERRERFAKGESRYDNIRDTKFAVIIGGHRIVASLAKDLIGKYEYVLIQSQRNPEKLRDPDERPTDEEEEDEFFDDPFMNSATRNGNLINGNSYDDNYRYRNY